MTTIDSHGGPERRIDKPGECPCCGTAARFDAGVPGDGAAVTVGFGCGATVHWRSLPSGGGWRESLKGASMCPSPGGRGPVQLFGEFANRILRDIDARLRWIGYWTQFVPSDRTAAWFGHYQVEGLRGITDFVDHLAAKGADLGFLPPKTFRCGGCRISMEGRPGQQYQSCPRCGGLMSIAACGPAVADIEQRHREGRDDLLHGVFG